MSLVRGRCIEASSSPGLAPFVEDFWVIPPWSICFYKNFDAQLTRGTTNRYILIVNDREDVKQVLVVLLLEVSVCQQLVINSFLSTLHIIYKV